jgi:tetratricopeptide (TPR) repeat protein
MKRLLYIGLIWFLSPAFAWAQADSLNKAIDYYESRDLVKARSAIDAASKHPSTSNLPNTWYLRGFIYKEYFKHYEASNPKSPAREEAVAAFVKVGELDPGKSEFFDDNVRQSLKYLGSTYYNTSSDFFTADGYKTAIEFFEKYKKCYLLANPDFNWKPSHIEFYLSLGTGMENIYVTNRKVNLPYMEITAGMYKKVLEVDTNNITAYYNLCMLYYNHGVSIINDMSDETDILDIDKIQERALEFFKTALPYALKAYS